MRKLARSWIGRMLLIVAASSPMAGCGGLDSVKRDETKMTPQEVVKANLTESIAAGIIAVKNLRAFNTEMISLGRYGSDTARSIQSALDKASFALTAAKEAANIGDVIEANSQLEVYVLSVGIARSIISKLGLEESHEQFYV